MFDTDAFVGHESVHHFHDADTGLRAIIAVHSTARGPAAGGCRMWNYATGADATRDALRLSEGMSYKNAVADLPLGGGKAVIWGDSRKDKSPQMFKALGRFIDSLNGVYWTAEDVGVSPDDMQHVATQTRYVAGLDEGVAASGDPSPLTAHGVYLGLLATARRALGTDDMKGVRVAVQGVGHVGAYLCDHLAKAGARLTIADVNQSALEDVASRTGAEIVPPDEIYDVDADVFSPNALGAIINTETLPRLSCKAIAGGANNQLATKDMGERVRDAGILYAPDYVINGGGIINVASEISGAYDKAWVLAKIDKLVATLGEILDEAQASGRPTNVVALELARQRIAEAG